MKIVRDPGRMQKTAQQIKRANGRIWFVPTMGALHAGHDRLLRTARRQAGAGGTVVASIFVNPTQFNQAEDLAKYPRPFAADRDMCRRAGVDVLFAPADLYEPDHSTWVEETELSQGRCGAHRPGHFKGVTTVVAKLFNLVMPDVALFGQKDAQQCDVIARMVRDLNFPVTIRVVPTVRERDGLAMSSRNVRLNEADRARAPELARALRAGGSLAAVRRRLERSGFEVDYVDDVGGRRCAAVWLGGVRLIDNVPESGFSTL